MSELNLFIRVGSHRAGENLRRHVLNGREPECFYSFSDRLGGVYVLLTEEEWEATERRRTGLSKPRKQNRSDYGKCWNG